MTSEHFTVTETRSESGVVLTLTGEIDMATEGELWAAAGRAVRGAGRVVLDFAAVTFCDSQGLSALIALNRQAAEAGGQLVLVNVDGPVARLFEITGLAAVFVFEGEPAGS